MPLPSMTITQQFTLTPKFLTRTGKPAPVDGMPTWGSSNEAVAKVVPAADALSALVVAQGIGDYVVSVSADADMGAGTRTVTAQDNGSVTQGEAQTVGFEAGPVEEQP